MRRPVLYLAGMLLATGASLALAGPASAAVDGGKCHHHQQHFFQGEGPYFHSNGGGGDFVYANNGNSSVSGLIPITLLSTVGGGDVIDLF
jgi:hypothetical protein